MLISCCMIVRDEADTLPRCLGSAAGLFDELVIVDTGSVDETLKIASYHTKNVYSLPWTDDFSRARNAAFSHATGDYLLWLDADDVVERADLSAFRAFLERERPDMVYCPYISGPLVYERERFLRREANFAFVGRVHEAIPPRGNVLRYPLSVRHLPEGKPHGRRNLDIYLKWAAEEPLSPRDLFYYGRELYENRLYHEAAGVLERMLSGEGWYVNKIAACEVLSHCFEHIGCEKEALGALFQSFQFGEPRAFILCEIGRIFLKRGELREAAFWYESALSCRDHTAEGDFEEPDARSITPLLQLVVCHWRLGDRERAYAFHKKAEAIAPAHPSVVFNRYFFESAHHPDNASS